MKRCGKIAFILLLTAAMLLSLPCFAASGRYTVNDGAVKNGPHDVEIVPNVGLVCNGKAQALFKTATVQDGVIWYRVSTENLWKELPLKESTEWTTEMPTAVEAGVYYVLVYIESTAQGTGARDSGSQTMPMACFRVSIAAK